MSKIEDLALVRRSALTTLNATTNPASVEAMAEMVAETEWQMAEAPIESLTDFIAASRVLAEMVLAGESEDERDEKLARNLLAAVERLTGAEAGASA